MRNLWICLLFLLLSSTLANAHVGNPDVYYEGDAGPYHLSLIVRLPKAIPGAGEIEVRTASPDVQGIKVVLLHLTGPGSSLEPAPDVAVRSRVDPQFFSGSLWFLEFGAMQVRIEVDGLKGKAHLSVPVASFASQSMPMSRSLGALLALLFFGLTLSVAPIVGGLVRESSVPSRQAPPAFNKRRSRLVMPVVLAVAVAFLYLNRAWWNAEAAIHDHNVDLLKPPPAKITLVEGNRLLIRPAAPLIEPVPGLGDREVKMSQLIPDHGHLMHLFLIAQPGIERMWHLHPSRTPEEQFVETLPSMPAGRYALFADITDNTGYPWTLVGNVTLPQHNGPALNGDDSTWAGGALAQPFSDTTVSQLPDGAQLIWDRGNRPLRARVPASFKFRVQASDGSPVHDLQPYMGMAAHAEVISSDMRVFAHIHPAGSVTMAALSLADTGSAAASEMAMQMPSASASLPPNFSFAYGFPQPGDYRIFVEIKRSGQVQTGVFDARVR